MAQDKNSFIIYSDVIQTVSKIPDEIAGKLFKIILEYVNDMNPVIDDLLLKVLFEPIKLSLKRDLVKWEDKRIVRSKSGSNGGKKSVEVKRKKKFEKEQDKKNITPVNIEDKKLQFAKLLEPYKEKYPREMLIAFKNYWTEPNKSKTKIKFELQQTWDLNLRLINWAGRDKNFNATDDFNYIATKKSNDISDGPEYLNK